ncbi:hypothetical protein [Pseudoalteromonas denitrificans]|uniref:Phage protein n=1 Tax=Pseudoalteromonas denitrificans DSM 6059 TaxID=1123010 RepID=A0A1I1T9E4_9GAMM|nr:hypothetical protein [Pseudoalteromonas denitrificans]SFD55205.1 hypothetical protein SAMN02745724_04829 [Pseudoalteromonas denitrificans DSM 6059]
MKLTCLKKLSSALIDCPVKFEFGGVLFDFTAQVKLVDEVTLTAMTTGEKVSDKKTVKDLLVGWSGFNDEGKNVPFDKETLDEMLVYGAISGRLAVECVNAQYRVIEKN